MLQQIFFFNSEIKFNENPFFDAHRQTDRRTELVFTSPHHGRESVYECTDDVQESLNENAGEDVRMKHSSQYVDSVRTVKSVRDGV